MKTCKTCNKEMNLSAFPKWTMGRRDDCATCREGRRERKYKLRDVSKKGKKRGRGNRIGDTLASHPPTPDQWNG